MGLFDAPGKGLFDVIANGFFVFRGTGLGLKSVGVGVGSALMSLRVGFGVGLATST
jgi:hypothetical protein